MAAYVGVPPEAFDITVPPGRVFLAGDSRSLANDSRLHQQGDGGTVAASAVGGRLVGVVWPLRHWGEPDGWSVGPDGVRAANPHRPATAFYLGSGLIAAGVVALLLAVALTVRRLVSSRANQHTPEW